MISLKSWRPDLNPSHNQHTIVQTGLKERTWNASKYFKKFCSSLYELSNLYLTQDLSILWIFLYKKFFISGDLTLPAITPE